jgi:glycosyltransferase involved in cell wall biosynthesis
VTTRPHILHVFSTFNLGGPQMRAVQLLNAWGGAFRHSIVSVGRGELSARDGLNQNVAADFPDFPDLKQGSLPARLLAIRKRLRSLNPDLILTYNWGAVEVVMSVRLFGGAPLVHHEDGFGPDEISEQLKRRVWLRRLALPGARHLIVPSKTLERTAWEVWRRPPAGTTYIPNGIDVALFDKQPASNAIPGLDRTGSALQVGTVAGLRPEKNLARLVRVFASASKDIDARLVIVGTGPEKEQILAEARAHGIEHRVHLPGFLADPHLYVGLFDVFALSSDTEQFPISLVEAMAARLPAVCTAVGDIPDIVSRDNAPFVAPTGDEAALESHMRKLLLDESLRRAVGAANRARVEQEFSKQRMVEAYERIYRSAVQSGMR